MSWINWQEEYWANFEELEKLERKVPVFAISYLPDWHKLALTKEQLSQVDDKWFIKAKLLTESQLEEIEEALYLDCAFSEIKWKVLSEIYRCL